MSKAEEILSKIPVESQGDYLKADVLSSMKEIAELAFDAGIDRMRADYCDNEMGTNHRNETPNKQEWIKQNF